MSEEKKESNKSILWVLAIAVVVIIVYAYNGINAPQYPYIESPEPFLGSENSTVTVVEFSDLQCPACRAAQPTFQRIVAEYGDNVRFEFRHFPLKSIHPYAEKAAEGAECAKDEGKFWEFIDAAYLSPSLTTSSLKGIAQDIGLDVANFTLCLKSGVKKYDVDLDLSEAISLGLPGTPMFLVNGNLLENWDYETFKSELDKALESK